MANEEMERRECFVTGDTNIVQSNFLIERKQKLSLPATQLLFTLTGMINKDDEDLMEYKINVSYFADLWGVDLKLAYQTVADALTELREKGINNHSINPQTGKKTFTTVGFISYGHYEQGEGYATITIAPQLKPHYIALQREFTKFSLDNILQLQENGAQVNTMRTYELLKQYQKLGKRKIAVAEYKAQLGLITYDNRGKVLKEKYKGSISNLQIKVLDPAVEKINYSTDLSVSYEINGRGKNAYIVFTIDGSGKKTTTEKKSPAPSTETEPRELTREERYVQDCVEIIRDVVGKEFSFSDDELSAAVYAMQASNWWEKSKRALYEDHNTYYSEIRRYVIVQYGNAVINSDGYKERNKKKFLNYFLGSLLKGYAKISPVGGESDDLDDEDPSQKQTISGKKKTKGESRRYGNFDAKDAFLRAIERSYREDGEDFDREYYEKLIED